MTTATTTVALRHRLAERGVDAQMLLLVPATVFVVALFIYPFAYGMAVSLQPAECGVLGA